MLTFDQAASVLRPLDRPDALVHRVSKNYAMTARPGDRNHEEEDPPAQGDEEWPECFDDEEMIPVDPEEDEPESDGEGNLTYLLFNPEEEYNEDEAAYIWAYNSAYRDVRKELQARKKGRQFFKPKGSAGVVKKGKFKGGRNGKGANKGKPSSLHGQRKAPGNPKTYRGTPEELMSKTRCFNCGQLGHISKECPDRDRGGGQRHFFVCQGSSSAQNRVYHASVFVNLSAEHEKKLAVFAGVATDGHEAIVDTAAEEGVIGSNAMKRLRESLSRFGLQPREATGATVTCAGIGGSARIAGMYDIPIGVAGTNGLLRVTEIADEGSFQTPFLLPISYIELVGATVDLGAERFVLKNGCSTPMRRAPSGHRAISITDFDGQWKLPPKLEAQLKIGSRNPFVVPKPEQKKVSHRPGVAVWLKGPQQTLQFVTTLDGPRGTLVQPHEVFSSRRCEHFEPNSGYHGTVS